MDLGLSMFRNDQSTEPISVEPQAPVQEPTPAPSEPSPSDPPAPPPASEPVNYYELIGTETGLGIKSKDDIVNAFTLKQQYEAENAAYKQEQELLDPRAKKIVEFYKSGASDAEIENWQKLQKIDIDKLEDIDKIKLAYKMSYPDLKDEDIEASILADFYDGDVENGIVQSKVVAFKERAANSAAQLSKHKINSETPESVTKRQAEVAQRQTELAAKQQHVEDVSAAFANFSKAGDLDKMNFKFDKITGLDEALEVNFEVPKNIKDECLKAAVNYCISNNIDPNKSSDLKSVYEFYAKGASYNQAMEAAINLAVAKATRKTIKAEGGSPKDIKPPIATGTAANPINAIVDRIKEQREGLR